MRIAFGSFQHEANSFCPQPTTMAAFANNWLRRGDELLKEQRGAATEDAGALSVLRQAPDVEILPLLGAKAGSGQEIVGAAYRALRDEMIERLRAVMPVDGVLFILHGAMMAEGADDASGDLLAHVRALVGPDVPIIGTCDLHANVTVQMATMATALVGYHTAPHIDLYETGQSAAKMMVATLRGEMHPTMALARLPLIVPAENARHTDGPLSVVINRALELERTGVILHGGVYSVQPWLDAPDVGCSVVIVTDNDPAAAKRIAHELGTMFWQRRSEFIPELVAPDDAVQRALAGEPRTVVLCDSADAPSSGGTGDSSVVLSALLRVAPVNELVLLNVVDPPAVAQAIAAGVGQSVTVNIGGVLAPNYFQPVSFTGRVKSLHDGEFKFKGQGLRGVTHHMGRTAVLVQGGIHLVVMERGVTQWDPELYRSLGLDPADARIVQVKSPAAFRAAYTGIADEILIVEAPGAASPALTKLPWKRLGRPIYPLDVDTAWQ